MIPNDPFMLLSYINTQLRDKYSSLDELCDDMDVSAEDIISKLDNAGYVYDKNANKILCK